MKLLIVGINYAPERVGIGKYTAEMAEWLAERGHLVRVVTAPPYYPAWEVEQGYFAWRYRREWRAGVDVWRCPLWVPRRPGGLRRLLHLASFAMGSLPVLLAQLRWRPEVVMVVEPPLFCVPQALLLARLVGARPWLHVQDFEVDAAFALGLLRSRNLRRWVSGIESALLRRFDAVSTISERMCARLHEKGVASGRSVLVPNWVDPQAIRPLPDTAPVRAEFGIAPDAIVALYAGNMGQKQGLEILADAAAILSDRPDILFVLCGEGSARADLIARLGDRPNVRFLPLQPVEKLNALLNLADIHLLPQRADAADLVMPSKLTGMLASGRPVVATAGAETAIRAVVRNCGIVVPPGDPDRLAAAVRELADDPGLRRRLGAAGRDHAEKEFSRDTILAKLEETLRKLVETPPAM